MQKIYYGNLMRKNSFMIKNEQQTYDLSTEHDTFVLAARLVILIEHGAVIFLQGPLGAGKTTFTRGLLRGLGYESKVKSPTYTLVEPYEIAQKKIFHFDFYRLKSANELEQLGIEEYFFDESICLIEWPEKGFPFLPAPDLVCSIAFSSQGRKLKIESRSEKGKTILHRLSQSI